MENKKFIEVWDLVQITMISKEWVDRQKFIPKLDTVYKVTGRTENSIQLYNEKYGTYTYYKGSLKLKIITPWQNPELLPWHLSDMVLGGATLAE